MITPKLKLTAVLILLLQLLSCLPQPPYEVLSRCVANPSDNPYIVNPCARRPANKTII